MKKLTVNEYRQLAQIMLYDFLSEIDEPGDLMCEILPNLNKKLEKKLVGKIIEPTRLGNEIIKQIIDKIKSKRFKNKLINHCAKEDINHE